jgi:DNA-binding transcriptional ArsR family regulator
MTKEVLDEKKFKKALKRFSALNHPKRLEIIEMLSEKPKMNVTEIFTRLNIEQAMASHHLQLLRDSGILNVKRKGKERHYSINQACFYYLLEGIEKLSK